MNEAPNHPSPPADEARNPLETSVRNLNAAVIGVLDAVAAIPDAIAVNIATTLHGSEAVQKRGLDKIDPHQFSRLAHLLRTRTDTNGPNR